MKLFIDTATALLQVALFDDEMIDQLGLSGCGARFGQ